MVQNKKAKGGKEIPTPLVREVTDYRMDYLPNFKERSTYIRGAGNPCSKTRIGCFILHVQSALSLNRVVVWTFAALHCQVIICHQV